MILHPALQNCHTKNLLRYTLSLEYLKTKTKTPKTRIVAGFLAISLWVYVTKKMPAENENSGFRIGLFSFLHSVFLSFTSGCPVLVKEDESEKNSLNAGFMT